VTDTCEARLPDPLPIRVRPVAGETVEAYIRRLARANHLRPSLLRVYLTDDSHASSAIRLDRLVAASGSTHAALTRALTGRPAPRSPNRRADQPRQPPTARKERLFAAIRIDHARRHSIRRIARDRNVHRRTVRQALDSPIPPPLRRTRRPRPSPVIGPIKDLIDPLLDTPLTTCEIWVRLTDYHESDASYSRIRDYVRHARTARADDAPSSDDDCREDERRSRHA
jgi:hypothetical protein